MADIPAPTGDKNKKLQALIVDSWFDSYLGVVSLIRIMMVQLKKVKKFQIFPMANHILLMILGYSHQRRFQRRTLIW